MATLTVVYSPSDCKDLRERLERVLKEGEPIEEPQCKCGGKGGHHFGDCKE